MVDHDSNDDSERSDRDEEDLDGQEEELMGEDGLDDGDEVRLLILARRQWCFFHGHSRNMKWICNVLALA